MPSINDVIARQALVRPDVYPDESKGAWLCELDGKLLEEVIFRHKVTEGTSYAGAAAVCPVCGSSELLEYNNYLDMTRCGCGWNSGPEVPKTYPEDGDKPLLVGAPYDNLYDLYLQAQVDLHNREMDNYNNSAMLEERAQSEWRRKWHQTHLPVSPMDARKWAKVVV